MQKTGAERLAEYRDRHGYKQYELAELLELAEAHLSQLLSGKRRPGLPIAVRIERMTGIPAESWLLTRVGKPKKASADDSDLAEVHTGKSHGPHS
jgi:transcriptional regulator with XRE-family HTH domain